MILDTHKFVEELIAVGFKKNQAEVFVNRLNESSNNLVTKADLMEAKYDMIKFIVPFLFAILLSIIGLWFKI